MLTLLVALVAAMPAQAGPVCVAPDGTRVQLELAVTPQEKATGLMYRDKLSADRGMLFVFDKDDILAFWMKNTLIPLDILWFDAKGQVVDVRTDLQPCRADPCAKFQNGSPARVVLLVNAGFARRHSVVPATRFVFEGVPGYPANVEKK